MCILFSAAKMNWFQEGTFLGKVIDEWFIDTQEFVHAKLPHLAVIAAIAYLLNRLLNIITYRMIHLAERHAASPERISQVKTLASVMRNAGLAVIGLIAGMQILDSLGVNLAPILASAGVAGVAIGLAAQSIVKDMLNGVFILIEDQFNVGDTVRIAGLTGVVEEMTLRKTTVRDADGTLYIVPNSQITTVANLNAGYSVATVNVSVDFSANPDKAMEMLKGIAMEVRENDAFREIFVSDPVILGMESIKGSELIFPVVFKTLATRQYAPVREFRRRVRLELEKEGLLPGDPNRVFSGFGKDFREKLNRETHESGPEHDPTLLRVQDSNPFTGE